MVTTPAFEDGSLIEGLRSQWARLREVSSRSSAARQTWNPSLFHLRPLLGITTLGTVALSAMASLLLLVLSDSQPLDDWRIQPTVYLAIVAAVSNCAIRIAHSQAIIVAWWYKAFCGSTVDNLEKQWEAGRSFTQAVRYTPSVGFAALATLFTSLMIVDGPMLQRASTVVTSTTTTAITLDLQLAPEVPSGFSGYRVDEALVLSDAVTTIFDDWQHNIPMQLECPGKCVAKVRGPGVAMQSCTSRIWPLTSEMLHDPNATWGSQGYVSHNDLSSEPMHTLPIFNVLLQTSKWPSKPSLEPEAALLYTGIATWSDFKGQYVERECRLEPAILEYDIIVEADQISIPRLHSQGRLIALANNTVMANKQQPLIHQPATMDALTMYLGMFVNANGTAAFYLDAPPGASWEANANSFNAEIAKHMDLFTPQADLSFVDPTSDIISDLNELMFRGGLMAANWTNLTTHMDEGLSPRQNVEANSTLTIPTFRSDFRWYLGATAVEVLAIVFMLPMFWGSWRLGREMSLSPLEIALAFNAPLLNSVNSGAGARGVVRDLGTMELQFGVVANDNPFSDEKAEGPWDASKSSGRLGFARVEDVRVPSHGMTFTV